MSRDADLRMDGRLRAGQDRRDGPAAAVPGVGRFEAAVARLEDLYAQLPALECLGLCADSCGEHIDASTVERRRVLAAGVDLDAPTADGACPALSRTFGAGRCSVHAVRPMVCRLWGTAASMPCPHGCRPAGGLVQDTQVMRWMLASVEAGGHHGGWDDPALRELLEVGLSDPAAAGLFGRFLRGDRSVTGELYARLTALRA
ncbi:hypothetical protein AB1207_22450 [Kineococcus endophyticus]|uniref:Zinc-or iron-chelating protein n=1 Tax=Kineococcus endophyticus TaxID=1181883 RepID=A0ABV3PDJ2_9ACTN